MARFRDFVGSFGRLSPGSWNTIADVPGVKVGHVTLIEGDSIRTGITAILPHGGNLYHQKVTAAVHTVNGHGKAAGFEQVREFGVIETPILLTNTLNVWRAADAVATYMMQDNPEIGVRYSSLNPVVGECNDGFLNDIRGRHVTESHVIQAIQSASTGAVAEGSVGAGTGTACYGFKGGIGTASRVVISDQHPAYMVGVLVQTNFGSRKDLTILGVPVGAYFLDDHLPRTGDGSIMIVIATDAPFDSRQLGRLAKRAPFALGRTGTVGNNGSGDFVIVFSTAHPHPHFEGAALEQVQRLDDNLVIDPFFGAVVEAIEEAIYNSLTAAETMTGRSGNTLYALPHDRLRDLLAQYGRI